VKNDVNVPSKSNNKKILEKISFFLAYLRSLTKRGGFGFGSGSVSQKYGSEDSDLDPYTVKKIYRIPVFFLPNLSETGKPLC
jgi:hypothetical protein